MARPTKPKDLKPKTDGEAAGASGAAPSASGSEGGFDMKFIIALAVVALISVAGTAGSTYYLTTQLADMSKKVAAPAHGEGGEGGDAHGGEGGHEAPANAVGMNLELDDFMVNLKPDSSLGGTQYLKAKMALSIKVPEAEDCYAKKHHAMLPAMGGQIVGAAAPVDRTMLANEGGGPTCEQIFKDNMGKYVPTIRDVINASLMKRTASSLASLEGQEALKDEIKEQLNQIMAPDYGVLRVNFQDFIIQR
jgi:flagellar basal body-associated protein FliL